MFDVRDEVAFDAFMNRIYGESWDLCPWASHYLPEGLMYGMDECKTTPISLDPLLWKNLNPFIESKMKTAFMEGVDHGKSTLDVSESKDNLDKLEKKVKELEHSIRELRRSCGGMEIFN